MLVGGGGNRSVAGGEHSTVLVDPSLAALVANEERRIAGFRREAGDWPTHALLLTEAVRRELRIADASASLERQRAAARKLKQGGAAVIAAVEAASDSLKAAWRNEPRSTPASAPLAGGQALGDDDDGDPSALRVLFGAGDAPLDLDGSAEADCLLARLAARAPNASIGAGAGGGCGGGGGGGALGGRHKGDGLTGGGGGDCDEAGGGAGGGGAPLDGNALRGAALDGGGRDDGDAGDDEDIADDGAPPPDLGAVAVRLVRAITDSSIICRNGIIADANLTQSGVCGCNAVTYSLGAGSGAVGATLYTCKCVDAQTRAPLVYNPHPAGRRDAART